MPSITAVPYPTLLNVRVEINWADVTQATHATVWRVDCVTGERSQLHPYVAYNGDGYLLLSCGQALFWDTEAPLDKCFYYCTTAQDAAGNEVTTAASLIAYDIYDRTVAANWGTSTSGHLWAPVVPADYSVSPTLGGGILFSAASTSRRATLDTFNKLNLGFRGDVRPTVVATGGPIDLGWLLRSDATTNNAYEFLVRFDLAGAMRVRINSIVAGSAANLVDTALPYTYTATSSFTVVGEVIDSTVRIRAFDATTPDPQNWQLTVTNTALTAAGTAGQAARIQAGNTNVPFTPRWDNLTIYDPCADLVTVEQCTTEITLASNGVNMLRDPLNPCHDRQVVMCWTADPVCVPGQGIFFARMEDQDYPSRSGALNPSNSALPVAVVNKRGGPDSTLVLVTRSFADRDAVVNLNRPGTVLLWQSPPAYGIADRYMGVGGLGEGRYNTDHRYQPRVMTLPHVSMDRPEGPANGVCGAQVSDLCDIYSSWDALIAAGLTWMDLLRGAASTDIPDLGERTWADVNSTYASWNAVNAGNTNWTDLLNGP